MKRVLAVAAAALLLAACSTDRTFQPKTNVRVITAMTYPEFPNMEPLPDVALIPWTHDMPRDTTIVSVKSLTACRKGIKTYSPEDQPHVVLPVEKQTVAWWKKCGENPILPNSNIFIGFSQEQWNIVLGNLAKLRERNWQYIQRMIEINRQRQGWRDKAEQERIRMSGENNVKIKPAANPTKNPKKPEEKSFFDRLFK